MILPKMMPQNLFFRRKKAPPKLTHHLPAYMVEHIW